MENTCPECGFPLDAETRACPRCALAGALGGITPTKSGENYEFIAELGRGGMGTVSLVRQHSLGRLVALKVLRVPVTGTEEPALLREARAAAAIQHAHVVAVHEIGRGPLGAFIAMEYCEGGDLRGRLSAGPLNSTATATLGVKLADAVSCAHAAGILHRDLKPSNVLLTAKGEPKLADFGLSGAASGISGELSRPDGIAGSPSYLAPELIAGEKPSPSVDIYGLGAILYECVTGRPPFTGESAAAIVAQVSTIEPVSPRRLNPSTPVDLDTIIRKCLEKQPARRYATAHALRDDLERFLGGRPVLARPVSTTGRAWRWAKRNPALASMITLLVAGAIAAAVVLGDRNAKLRQALAQSEALEGRTRAALRDSLLAQARAVRQSGRQGQRFETLRLLRAAAAITGADNQIRTEAVAAMALDDWSWHRQLPTFPQLSSTTRIAFTADLSHFAIADATGTGIELRRTSDNALIRPLEAAKSTHVSVLTLNDNGAWVGAYYVGEHQAVWGPGDTKARWIYSPAEVDYGALAFAPDASGWWFTGPGHRLHWHDAASGAEHPIGERGARLYGISPSPDGNRLALIRDDGIEVWDLRTEQKIWTWTGDVGFAPAVWSPDGNWIASDRQIGAPELVIWNAATGEPAQTMRVGQLRTIYLAFHPDGRQLLSTDSDAVTRIWDRWTGAVLVSGKTGQHVLQVSRDGTQVAAGLGIGRFGLVNLAAPDAARALRLDAPKNGLWRHAETSPDGHWLLSSTNQSVHLWSAASGREIARQDFERDERANAVFDPRDGSIIFSGLRNGLWRLSITPDDDPEAARLAKPVKLPAPPRTLVRALPANGKWWWVEDYQREQGFAWPDGDPAREISLAGQADYSINLPAPSGRWFAWSCHADGTGAAIARWPANEIVGTIAIPDPAWSVFSPDDRWLVLATKHGYDFRTGADLLTPAGKLAAELPASSYGFALFSPNGTHLALATGPHTITIVRPGDWSTQGIFTLPRETELDAWSWSADSQRLFVFSGTQSGVAFDLKATNASLTELGLGRFE